MKASKSLSSYLTCNLVPRHDAGSGQYDVDAPQPQTATCCTALHRAGFAADGAPTTHPRYAPLRTPGSAAMLVDDPIDEEEEQQSTPSSTGRKKAAAATATKTMIRKMVRKCKSSVADVDVSQVMATSETKDAPPRLRRSGAVRRDWSFEDLRASRNAA